MTAKTIKTGCKICTMNSKLKMEKNPATRRTGKKDLQQTQI